MNINVIESTEREALDIEAFAIEHPDVEKPPAGVYIIRNRPRAEACA